MRRLTVHAAAALAGLALAASGCAPGAAAPVPERQPRPGPDLPAVAPRSVRPVTPAVSDALARCVCQQPRRPLDPSERPLYLLDGTRISYERFKGLAPASLESVEILVEPDAVERYGPGAAQGAVVLRTRHAAPPPRP